MKCQLLAVISFTLIYPFFIFFYFSVETNTKRNPEILFDVAENITVLQTPWRFPERRLLCVCGSNTGRQTIQTKESVGRQVDVTSAVTRVRGEAVNQSQQQQQQQQQIMQNKLTEIAKHALPFVNNFVLKRSWTRENFRK